MNEDVSTEAIDVKLRAALGEPAKPDFSAWQSRHADAVAYLNPVVTASERRKRRLLIAALNLALAAGLGGLLIWVFGAERQSFAQAIKAIDKAQTITWTLTVYQRMTSQDGQRTWLKTDHSKCAYRSPGLYRTMFYDNGNLTQVEITDSKLQKTLRLDMKLKQAVWTERPRHQIHDPGEKGAFAWVAEALKKRPVEWVGQRNWKGETVNVFRLRREQMKTRESYDIWISTQTKQIVGELDPGADYFDPTTETDRDHPAEERFSKGKMLGSVTDDIVYDAKLDATQFSFSIPEGFELVTETPRPLVTEPELVEFLGAAARFNGDTFPESEIREYDMERLNAAGQKSEADRGEAERKLLDLAYKHTMNHNGRVILAFADDNTVAGSFRYMGKNVKLGAADRIVCWYRLKSTGGYRAIFGDLAVKDVSPQDLPLPVGSVP